MKILLICNGYPPHRWAGTETYTAGIAEELSTRGHQVQVLCAGEWESGAQYWNGISNKSHRGVQVRRLNLNWRRAPDPASYLYDNPIIAEHVTEYLRELQPDVVHVTSCETLSASVLQSVNESSIPLVLSLTDFWFLCPRTNLLRSDGVNCSGITTAWECLRCQLLGKRAYEWTRRVCSENSTSRLLLDLSRRPFFTRKRGLRGFACDMEERKAFLTRMMRLPGVRLTASEFVRTVFVNSGISDSIKVQPYGHDLSWLENYQGKTPSRLTRIGFIGQVVKEKGVHLLLEAAQQLQPSLGDQFSLVVYGNTDKIPEYGERLRAMSAQIRNIEFAGTYQHSQSAAVFAGIDILVVPSLWYDFPLIIHEAFATRTPVITTRLGGMAETVTHDLSGLLFQRENVNDLAQQISRVVSEPGLLQRLQAGIPDVKTIQAEVNELEEAYGELIGKSIAKRPEAVQLMMET